MGHTQSSQSVKKYYTFESKIASGSFGIVWRATNKENGKSYAIKVIKKADLKQEADLQAVYKEIKVMEAVNHANCVRFYKVFESKRKFQIVMELLSGCELFDRIVSQKHFSERAAAKATKDVASALEYLHGCGIVHRDLKPENMIFLNKEANSPVKLVDFGLARFFKEDEKMYTACGTPAYVAPEILLGKGYGAAVDLWSLGILVYVMLCGFQPFRATSRKKLLICICRGQFEFPQKHWGDISSEAKDLIQALLTLEPKERLSAEQVLAHPWIKGHCPDTPFKPSQIARLQQLQDSKHGLPPEDSPFKRQKQLLKEFDLEDQETGIDESPLRPIPLQSSDGAELSNSTRMRTPAKLHMFASSNSTPHRQGSKESPLSRNLRSTVVRSFAAASSFHSPKSRAGLNNNRKPSPGDKESASPHSESQGGAASKVSPQSEQRKGAVSKISPFRRRLALPQLRLVSPKAGSKNNRTSQPLVEKSSSAAHPGPAKSLENSGKFSALGSSTHGASLSKLKSPELQKSGTGMDGQWVLSPPPANQRGDLVYKLNSPLEESGTSWTSPKVDTAKTTPVVSPVIIQSIASPLMTGVLSEPSSPARGCSTNSVGRKSQAVEESSISLNCVHSKQKSLALPSSSTMYHLSPKRWSQQSRVCDTSITKDITADVSAASSPVAAVSVSGMEGLLFFKNEDGREDKGGRDTHRDSSDLDVMEIVMKSP
eukprot:gb/GEZN01002690.1/.p1 GENE.gb/GEZN01002690.1/~~gb/GEZN01002690.1/.p1  ORF type:complete len:713 (-),score=81.06 gb/GEZN01002690.1/:160-2298(-)